MDTDGKKLRRSTGGKQAGAIQPEGLLGTLVRGNDQGLAIFQPLVQTALLSNLEGGAFVFHLAEAVAAIHRTVATGPERDHRIGIAFGTDYRVHLAG